MHIVGADEVSDFNILAENCSHAKQRSLAACSRRDRHPCSRCLGTFCRAHAAHNHIPSCRLLYLICQEAERAFDCLEADCVGGVDIEAHGLIGT